MESIGWDWSAEVELPSRLGAHLPFLDEVLAAIADLGWEGRDYFGVQMTLEEALSNAIRHGNREDEAKVVRAECRATRERFWLSVEDEGEGYRLQDVPDCTDEENLERFGGRGMALIHCYMEEVTFNERGNRITVATRRGYKPPEDDDGVE